MSKFRSKISMSFSLFLAVFLCGIASCVLISFIVIHYNKRHAYDSSRNRITEFARNLSEAVALEGYKLEPDDYEKGQLDAFARTYEGRILLANRNLSIVYDSYNTKVEKNLLVPDAVACLRGESVFHADESESLATVMLPIAHRSKEGAAGVFLMSYPVKEELGHFQTGRRMILMMCLMAAIIIVAYATVCAIIFVRPLIRMKRQLDGIRTGNPDDRLDINNNRQVYDISESVNSILEHTRETEETRRNFVSDVSHELKTPMASMKVLSDSLLLSGEELPPMVREFLNDINSEIDRENHIISDLLTLARMDRRTDTMRFERTHINGLMDVILNRVRPIAEPRAVEVVYESFRNVYADVDGPKLVTALTNIVENAILYNRPQGSVYVTLNANLSYFFVTVRDTGYGIPEADIARIFERFYRVDKDRSRETGGTGLGLAITKEIIVAHDGQIKAYSKEQEGTTISVRIPLERTVKGGGVA